MATIGPKTPLVGGSVLPTSLGGVVKLPYHVPGAIHSFGDVYVLHGVTPGSPVPLPGGHALDPVLDIPLVRQLMTHCEAATDGGARLEVSSLNALVQAAPGVALRTNAELLRAIARNDL